MPRTAACARREWTAASHRVIWHGRRVCHARRPACGACGVAPLCPSFGAGPTDEAIARERNTSAYAGFGKIVQEVIGAAYTAFHDGLHAALYLSAGLMLGTGLLALITLRSRPLTGEGK